jgi:hypothetical protein
VAVDRVAAQAVGRDSPVTGNPACYLLAVVRYLRDCRESGSSKLEAACIDANIGICHRHVL